MVVYPTGLKISVKFCDSRSSRSRDTRLPHFVTNDNNVLPNKGAVSFAKLQLHSAGLIVKVKGPNRMKLSRTKWAFENFDNFVDRSSGYCVFTLSSRRI